MKKKKTNLDHLIDFLLILAPFVLLFNIDIYTKSMLMFYVFYLPYLVYSAHKFSEENREKQLLSTVKKKQPAKKKVEIFV